MSLKDEMTLTNIACDETSGVDIGGNWIEADACHVVLRFNEDDEADIEFHMILGRENLQLLKDWIDVKLSQQPINIQ